LVTNQVAVAAVLGYKTLFLITLVGHLLFFFPFLGLLVTFWDIRVLSYEMHKCRKLSLLVPKILLTILSHTP
jgi:TRAP-type mannitol/chloroaromatic compound transport system permease small subunit